MFGHSGLTHCSDSSGSPGVVYNITPYFKFHPGGKEELMEGAGKDCTLLFDEASVN